MRGLVALAWMGLVLAACRNGWAGPGQQGSDEVVRGAVPVRLEKGEAGDWRLFRDGVPYRIQGAGGEASFALLRELGGNSGRTWGVDEGTAQRLDEAHREGVTVAVGIWLEHKGKGFDYSDPEDTAEQLERSIAAVLAHRDHPAVLLWGVGNEMEGATGDDPDVWKHVEAVAARIKELDPAHPVMTVIAEIGGNKIEAINRHCPSIDIIGINSYGGVETLATRYIAAGGTKPYIVTEFGPNGAWEIGRNPFGAVEEQTSTAKTELYRTRALAIARDRQLCLGSYAFLWGHKQEATATWFGLLLPDEFRTGPVDALTEIWTGAKPANGCPEIARLAWTGEPEAGAGALLTATLSASDPEGEPLQVRWTVLAEADRYITNGDFQAAPPEFDDALVTADIAGATVRAPGQPGIYRLYVEVRDGHRGAATANLPFRVR